MDEEVKTGEMTGLENEDITSIEEDYTQLESDTVTIDDDSDLQNDVLYNEAMQHKETLDEVKAEMKEVLLAILEKGEINANDTNTIEQLQEQYTESYTALQILAGDNDIKPSNSDVNTSNVVINGDIDYEKLMDLISEKADWLYIDEDGQIMLNGEAVPKLKVMELEAEKIKADLVETKELVADKATIGDLDATNANITNLTALVAQIQTLVGGNLTMDNIHSLVLTSDKVTIANALIKDAMIETISANKINTGTINTNNVSIQSEDGSLIINGTTQQFKDNTGKVRIQIGKDAQGNFTFCLFSQDGVGILIDETGIKAGAVPDQIITNDMVSDNANISGGKLDISSVISSINNNVNTINSSKIKFDDTAQTLDVAFNQLKTKVETIEDVTISGDLSSVIEQVTTNTTNIQIAQGQINQLIANTTITKEDGTVTQLKDEFNSVKDTVSSHTQTINSLQTNYNSTLKTTNTQYYVSTSATQLTGGSWQDTSPTWETGKYIWQRMKYTYTNNNVTYSTAICIQGAKGQDGTDGKDGTNGKDGINGQDGAKGDKGDTGEKGQSLVKSTPQWYASTSNTSQTGGSWTESMPTIDATHYLWLRYKLDWQNPTNTTYTTPTLEQIAESVKEVSAKQSEFKQDLDGFKMTVSETYFSNDDFDNLNIGTRNLLLRTDESRTLTGNYNENQYIDLYRISDPTLLAGKTATLSFKYTLTGWNGQGGIKPQTASSTWDAFDQVWFTSTGTFEYNSTITFSSTNADTVLQLRADWLGGTVTILANTAILVISDKKADWSPAPEDVASDISIVEQTANKINWVVGSGTNQSNMTLTREAYDLVSQNITLTAEHINLNGYVSNEDSNWSIDEQGNMEAKNLAVEGELSTDILNVNKINNPQYPATLSGDISLYVNNITGNDDYSLDEVLESYDESEAQNSADLIKKFYSLRGVESALPRNLNGKTVRIYCETDDNGQVLFRNFTGGRILIFLCSHEVKGYLGDYNCYCDFKIYGGSDTSEPSTYGVIRPSTNTVYNTDNCSVFFQKSPACGIYYVNIYGGASTSGYSALKVTEDCMCRIENCNFYSAYTFVNASSLAQVYVATTAGMATDYAFKSYTGSTINLANTKQANGKNGNAYWSNGSVIFGSLSQTIVGNYNITWDSSTPVENNTTTSATTTATATYKANYGDTYRSSVYNNWKKDNTCRQGNWGYGNCTGLWFFGTQFAELKGKTITKVTIKISRQSGGSSASVEHKLWMHNHSTRPSGAPSLTSGWSKTFNLAVGNSTTITITDSTVLNAIKNGTCKGFAIRHTYDSSHYSVCSGSATVKITYQE